MRQKLQALAARLLGYSKRVQDRDTTQRFLIEEIEPRVLHSADNPILIADHLLAPESVGVVRLVSPVITPVSTVQTVESKSVELVVIDRAAPKIDLLLDDLQKQQANGRAIQILLLDSDTDFYLAVSNKLDSISQQGQMVTGLHLIGHGDAQGMQLGQTRLNSTTIDASSEQMSAWQTVFSQSADVLLYGCDFAANDNGKQLATRIAQITGADVAASTDLTGSERLGGNWNLEFQTGAIESKLVLSEKGQAEFNAVLAFSPVGAEQLVNTNTVGAQTTTTSAPAVAMAANGSYAVVYVDAANNGDIYVARFDATGLALGPAALVNTSTQALAGQSNATIAMDATTGDFVVAWNGEGAGDTDGIFYRRFNSVGVALDPTEVLANVTTLGNQADPSITLRSIDDFYIAWTDSALDLSGSGVYARRFANGGPYAQIQVNVSSLNDQAKASIAVSANGTVVVAWESDLQDGSGRGVYFRRFDSTLAIGSVETQVNAVTTNNQSGPSVSINAGGSVAIAWQSENVDGSGYAIALQRYDSAGAAVGSNISPINTYTVADQDSPQVALADDGTFVVTWNSTDQDTVGGSGVFAQAFKANGSADGAEFLVNTTTALNQVNASIAFNGNNAIVAWSGNGALAGQSDTAGVFVQRYARTVPAAPTTAPVAFVAIAEDSGPRLVTQAQLLVNAADIDTPLANLVATALTISSGSGVLVNNLDGTWTYTPNLNDDSAVTFSYLISDGVLTVAGVASLDITPVNDSPTSTPVTLTAIAEDALPRTITQAQLLGNASDVDTPLANLVATNLTVSAGSGTLISNGNGTWNYTPALNDDSNVSFAYSISDGNSSVIAIATLDITPVNDAPTSPTVTLLAIIEDTGPRIITQAQLLANASDVDSLAASLVASGLTISSGLGSLVNNNDGTWTYTSLLNDDTNVTFNYSVSDGILSVATSANLDITPVNDSPTSTPVTLTSIGEDSGSRLITQTQLLGNASDVDTPLANLVATNLTVSAGSGTLISNGNGTWNYTPALNDDSNVSFSYSISDGNSSVIAIATLDITPVNDAPTSPTVTLLAIVEDTGPRIITQAQLLANATDVDSLAASLVASGLTISSGLGSLVNNNNGTWTYTSLLNDDTNVTFNYSVSDGILSVAASANLDITPVNDSPTSTPVTLTAIAEDGSPRRITQAQLLVNATDVDSSNASLIASNLTISSGLGALVNNGDGTWTYSPALNDDTSVVFTYLIGDGNSNAIAIANLDITPINDAPTSTPVTLLAIVEDSAPRIITQAQLLANASDVDSLPANLVASGLTITSGLGSLVNNNDGTWTYTALLNDDTNVSFSFSVSDGFLATAATANLDITPFNDTPISAPVTLVAMVEDGSPRTISQAQLLANASDVDSPSANLVASNLTISSGLGTLVNNGNGTWTYTPSLNDDTNVVFNYLVSDGNSSTSGLANLDITPVNDAPTTTPVTLIAIVEDSGSRTITQVQLLANALDVDTPSANFVASNLVIATGLGSLVNNNNGTWTYTPALNDSTNVSFNYIVSDGVLNVAGSALLDITPVDDTPTTAPITLVAIAEDSGARTITQAQLLANAADVDTASASLVAAALTIASGSGTLLSLGNGSWTYTPALNDDTAVTFAYLVGDGNSSTAGSASLDITPVNDAPTSTPVALTAIAEDSGPRTINQAQLLVNASDVDSLSSSFVASNLTKTSGLGTLVNNGNGTWTYSPALNDDTNVSFSFTVSDGTANSSALASLDITPVNDRPTTTPTTLAAIAEDSGGRLITQAQLLANASDIDTPLANLLATGLTINSGNGTLVDNLNGTWTYTPWLNDDSSVSFSYLVSDGFLSAATTAELDITAVDDLPTTSLVTLPVIAEDGAPRTISRAQLMANAADVDTLVTSLTLTNLVISSGAGSLVDNGGGTWTYTPFANDDSSVTFTYSIGDGTSFVTGTAVLDFTPVNDAPTTTTVVLAPMAEDSGPRTITQAQLLANASDIDNTLANLSVSNLTISLGAGTLVNTSLGVWTYTPALNDSSSASFSYTISDGALSTVGTATLDITPVDDAPTTSPVILAPIAEDSGARSITQAQLLANAADVDTLPANLRVLGLTIGSGSGTLQDLGGGNWTYTPLLNDDTGVTFTYSVSDGNSSTIGSATLDITAINDAPTTTPIALASIAEDSGPRTITRAQLLAGVSDVDTAAASLIISNLVINTGAGTLVDNGGGVWTYTPFLNDSSNVTFTYGVSDGSLSSFGIVLLDITPVDDAPISTPVALTPIAEDSGPRQITRAQLLANTSDVDTPIANLTITGLSISAGQGTLVANPDGTWTYTPFANDDTSVTFSYTVNDASSGVAASATLDITPVNDAPTTSTVVLAPMVEDSGTRLINQAQLLANASDIDTPNNGLSATGLTISSGRGSLVNNNDGTWTYTPAINDDTNVTFGYIVTDGGFNIAAIATLDITPVNDAPTTSNVNLLSIAEDSGARTITQAQLLLNASDPESPIASLSIPTLSIITGNGTLVSAGIGTWIYTPLLNDDSGVTFGYVVSDGLLSTAGTATLDITPVNDRPVALTPGLGVTYTEDGVRAQPMSNVRLTDVDSPNLFRAVITLSNPDADDVLVFTNQNGITGSFVSGSNVLTLTGTASVANYEAAIRSIQYYNKSDLFVFFQKDFSLQVSDNIDDSIIISERITLVSSNDAPRIFTNTGSTVLEAGSVTIAVQQLAVTDPDNTVSQLTYTVVTAPLNGRLEFNTRPGVSIATTGFTQADIDSGRLVYVHLGSETASDSFSFSVSDGAGGVSPVYTYSIAVTPVDDPAIVALPIAPLTFTEDAGAIFVATGVTVDDPDSTVLSKITIQVASGFSAGNDLLLVNNTSLPAGIVAAWDNASGTLTLQSQSGSSSIADFKVAMELVQFQNLNQSPDVSVRSLSVALFKSGVLQSSATRQLNVVSVNDAPVVNAPVLPIIANEDATIVLPGSNQISVSDVDAGSGIVRVTLSANSVGLGARISLSQISGLTFSAGDGINDELMEFDGTIANVNAALSGLSFNAGTNVNGNSSFKIMIDDRSNLGVGGPKTGSAQVNFSLTPINDSPTISGSLSAPVLQGGTVVLTAQMFGVTDVDNSSINLTFNAGVLQNGRLELVASPSAAITSFTLDDVERGRVQYRHNGTNTTLDAFTVNVSDGFSVSTTQNFRIVITALNVAPVISPVNNPDVEFIEGHPGVLLAPTFTIVDVDSLNIYGATIRMTTGYVPSQDQLVFIENTANQIRGSISTQGVLSLSGFATVADYEAAIRSVRYVNSSDAPILSPRIVQIQVSDGFAPSNVSIVRVSVVATNDAPTIQTLVGGAGYEDLAFTASNAIRVSDIDLGSGLLRVKLSSTDGSITLSSLTSLSFEVGDGLNDSTMTFVGTQAAIDAALNSVSFLGLPNYNGLAKIDIEVSDFGDSNGANPLTSFDTLTIALLPVNDAPELSGSTSKLTYAESSGAQIVFSDLVFADRDSTNINGAVVSISNGFVRTEDRLSIANAQGLNVLWDANTGVLTLSGVASSATYQAVLRSITFEDISRSAVYADRTVSVRVSDSSLQSAPVSRVVQVIATNDAPILNAGSLTGYSENSPAVAIAPTLSISDIDSVNLSGASLRISSSYQLGEDILSVAGTGQISVAWDASTGTIRLTGVASLAAYEQVLRQVSFQTLSENPTGLTREFVVQLIDDTGVVSSNSIAGFSVVSINDAPVLTLGQNLVFAEDSTNLLTGAIALNDLDGAQSNQVLTLRVNHGSLSIRGSSTIGLTAGATAGEIILTGTLAQFSSALSQLVYTSEPDFNGAVLLQLSVQDGFGARDVRSLQIQITPVNDAPTVTGPSGQFVTVINGTSGAVLNAVALQDIDSPLFSGASVRIDSNHSAGDQLSAVGTNRIQAVWNGVTGTLVLTGSASLQEYQTVLRSLEFSTLSTNLAARSISVSVLDSSGASASFVDASRIINKFAAPVIVPDAPAPPPGPAPTPPPAPAPPPLTSAPTPSASGPTPNQAPPAPLATNDTGSGPSASLTGSAVVQAAAGPTSAAAAADPRGQSKSVGGQSNAAFGSDAVNRSLSGSDENQADSTRRARVNEVGSRSGAATSTGTDGIADRSALSSLSLNGRNSEADSRSNAAADVGRDSRLVDLNGRLLQIAQRETQQSANASTTMLRIAISAAEGDSAVDIKISKTEQLAVDFLSLPVQSGGVVVSAAVLWWITRAGGLLTALLTSLPSWQHFDPLPVLTATDGREDEDWGDENEEDDRELDAVLAG
jgi:VCBS repeat-containing protein